MQPSLGLDLDSPRRRDLLLTRLTHIGRWLIDSSARQPIPFVILSYPRSGNHWVRYIVEWTTGSPTLGAGDGEHWRDRDNRIDRPIHERTNLPGVDGQPVAKKRHLIQPWDRRDAALIFVLRDPLACISRHLATMAHVDDGVRETEVGKFLEALRSFDEWPSSKLLVDYDELMTSPEQPVRDLVTFVGGREDQAAEFVRDLGDHRANALATLLEPPRSGQPGAGRPTGTDDVLRTMLTAADADLAARYLDRWV